MLLQQYGYSGSPMMAGATNPELVRRQISQDLGYYGNSPMQQFSNNTAQGQFSQFGTNPQAVRQQIAQDLGYTQGAFQNSSGYNTQPQYSSQQQHFQGYQPIQNQQYYNPSVFQQVMSASPTEAQWVRQQIQQDIQAGSQIPSHIQGMQGYQQGYQSVHGASTLSQFGTSPQIVQNHIQRDLQNAPYQSSGYNNQQQHYGTGTFAQFGTNPQLVQSQIRNDLNQYNTTSNQSFGQQGGMGMMSQFATNPQVVRQQIQNDLGHQGGYYY